MLRTSHCCSTSLSARREGREWRLRPVVRHSNDAIRDTQKSNLLFMLLNCFKVVRNFFQYFPRVYSYGSFQRLYIVWCENDGIKKLPNKWWNIATINYDLLKIPLDSALNAFESKMRSMTPSFYYRIVISMSSCNIFPAKF